MGCMLGPVAEAIQVVSDKISLLTSASTGAIGKAMAAHPGTQDAAARLEVTMFLIGAPAEKEECPECVLDMMSSYVFKMSNSPIFHSYFTHISLIFPCIFPYFRYENDHTPCASGELAQLRWGTPFGAAGLACGELPFRGPGSTCEAGQPGWPDGAILAAFRDVFVSFRHVMSWHLDECRSSMDFIGCQSQCFQLNLFWANTKISLSATESALSSDLCLQVRAPASCPFGAEFEFPTSLETSSWGTKGCVFQAVASKEVQPWMLFLMSCVIYCQRSSLWQVIGPWVTMNPKA